MAGFSLAGHHRSKDTVQAWTQGSVRVVVFEAPEDTRRPAQLAALGFQVQDHDVAAHHAERLLARPVDRSQRADETVLHGVLAPDGTELFFGPDGHHGVPPWLGEFGADAEDAPSSSLLTGVDHVNLAQPWQHYDEAVFFLTSLLNLHHTVAQRARRRGLEFLPVPRNYYEDLLARFDMDPDLVALLEAHGLLYDRDENGEFLHFYTATLGEVFVEVVERRGGYAGFGASNAPVRLAAQYRELAG